MIAHAADEGEAALIVFGMGRYGKRMTEQLRAAGLPVLGVDFDPTVVHGSREIPVRFGDAEDPDFLTTLPLSRARWVVSTLPPADLNLGLFHALREHGYQGSIALTARFDEDAERLRHAGADWVLEPFMNAADFVARRIVERWEAARRDGAAS